LCVIQLVMQQKKKLDQSSELIGAKFFCTNYGWSPQQNGQKYLQKGLMSGLLLEYCPRENKENLWVGVHGNN